MLVFGDPQFETNSGALYARLHRALSKPGAWSLDEYRALFIEAGQFEQAMADRFDNASPLLAEVMRLTDLAAGVFYRAWTAAPVSSDKALEACRLQLSRICVPHCPLTVKVPEGFAFYGLFPEQYALAALAWAEGWGNRTDRPVLVIGIRSIGASLSSLVAVTLADAGWKVQRLTVRPGGDPWHRTVSLPDDRLAERAHVLVVDEGPGMSGSTMVSVAQAVGRDRVVLLPGHDGNPGSATAPEIRAIWRSLPKSFVPLKEVRWHGQSLKESLDAAEFEPSSRMKFLSQGKLPVLWKFAGLGGWCGPNEELPTKAWNKLMLRAEKGWSAAPIAVKHGFIAIPWKAGRALTPSDFERIGIERLGRYLGAVAEPWADPASQMRAVDRLCQIIRRNTALLLDAYHAWFASRMTEKPPPLELEKSYGDGDMSPHHWIEAADGAFLKTGSLCRPCDHTFIGPQSVMWDIAGTIIEWERPQSECFRLAEAAGVQASAAAHRFYLLAYTAFRAGQISFRLDSSQQFDEQRRLRRTLTTLRRRLAGLLIS